MFRISHYLLLTALASLLCAPAYAEQPPAQIAVSPSRLEVEIGDQPISKSVRLFNLSDRDAVIKLSLATWDLDESNQVRIVEPHEQSLDQWMVINPLRFEVPAGSTQTVRFVIRPRVKPTPGEHRAMIFFEEELPEAEQAKVRVHFRIGVPIYGFAGEVRRAGTLNAIEVAPESNPALAGLDITSTGSVHVRMDGQYAIWPADAYPGKEHTEKIQKLGMGQATLPDSVLDAGLLPSLPVLAGNRRQILLKTHSELPPGRYILDLNADLGDDAIDLAIPFSVNPEGEMIATRFVPGTQIATLNTRTLNTREIFEPNAP